MTGPGLTARDDWSALRRCFAGEALARVLAFCGWQAGTGAAGGGESCPTGAILLHTQGASRRLEVGSVELRWKGSPLTGVPPDWPGSVSPAAARFFLTARPLAEPVGLDFDLAARRDAGSPYHFTCCTEKRLCALLSQPGPEGLAAPGLPAEGRALALAVDRFPAAVRRAAQAGDPCFVNRYAVELAGQVRRFLRACSPAGKAHPLLAAAEAALGNALGILMVEPSGRRRPRAPDVRYTPQAPIYQRMT